MEDFPSRIFKRAKEKTRARVKDFEARIRSECDERSLAAVLLRAAGGDVRLEKGLLRFVSVLPTLRGTREIYNHFRQFVLPHTEALPSFLRVGAKLISYPLFCFLGTRTVVLLIRKKVAPRFIVSGERELRRVLLRYEKLGAEANIDFLGEDVVSWAEAEEYFTYYINAMKQYGGKERPFHVAVKFSALHPFFSPENYKESRRVVGERFAEFLRVARETNSFIAVDAELHARQAIVLDIFSDCIMRPEFRSVDTIKIAVQAYKKEAMDTAQRLVALAKERGTPFWIRLVKGAYLETERALAEQKNWSSPVWDEKVRTDETFDEVCAYLMANWGTVYVSPATHNPANILFAEHYAEELGIADDPRFFFEVLYGLGEPILQTLLKNGKRVLVYVPFLSKGNLLDGMGYFARRLEENTSNQNFLSGLTRPPGG